MMSFGPPVIGGESTFLFYRQNKLKLRNCAREALELEFAPRPIRPSHHPAASHLLRATCHQCISGNTQAVGPTGRNLGLLLTSEDARLMDQEDIDTHNSKN